MDADHERRWNGVERERVYSQHSKSIRTYCVEQGYRRFEFQVQCEILPAGMKIGEVIFKTDIADICAKHIVIGILWRWSVCLMTA